MHLRAILFGVFFALLHDGRSSEAVYAVSVISVDRPTGGFRRCLPVCDEQEPVFLRAFLIRKSFISIKIVLAFCIRTASTSKLFCGFPSTSSFPNVKRMNPVFQNKLDLFLKCLCDRFPMNTKTSTRAWRFKKRQCGSYKKRLLQKKFDGRKYDEHQWDFMLCRPSRIALSLRCHIILTIWTCSVTGVFIRALFGLRNGCLVWFSLMWDRIYLMNAVFMLYTWIHSALRTHEQRWAALQLKRSQKRHYWVMLRLADVSNYCWDTQCSWYVRIWREGCYSWTFPYVATTLAKEFFFLNWILCTVSSKTQNELWYLSRKTF